MLVLSRKPKQKILIGKDVVVSVQHIKGGRVAIGIEAPKSVPIEREEIRRAA